MIPDERMLWRIVWKEYRAQRGFWLVLAGFAVGLMLLFLAIVGDQKDDRRQLSYLVAFTIPALYALGCGAMLFASEREEGTYEFLRILAADPHRLFAGKVSFAFFSTAAMYVLLLLAAWGLSWGYVPRVTDFPAAELVQIGLFPLECLVWGIFFSLLVRKVLVAVFPTAFVPLLLTGYAHGAQLGHWYDLILLPALLAASYVIAEQTLTGPSREWKIPRFASPRVKSRPSTRTGAVEETAPAWRRLFTRLLWVEMRHVFTTSHVLWLVVIALTVWGPYPVENVINPLGVLLAVLWVPMFLGVTSCRSEEGGRLRFLAEHGIAPQLVWLSKQVVWIPLTTLITAAFIGTIVIADQYAINPSQKSLLSWLHNSIPRVNVTTAVAVTAALSYSAGQFASMLIARTVIAGFVAFVLSAVFAAWLALMVWLRVPLWFSVAPLAVVLMAATLGWSRNWLLERATRWSWLRLASWIALSLVLVYAAVGVYRVFEIPQAGAIWPLESASAPPPPRVPLSQPLAPEESATAELYRWVIVDLKEPFAMVIDKGRPNGPAETVEPTPGSAVAGWEHATTHERDFLAVNQDVLQRVLAATERAGCVFRDPSGVGLSPALLADCRRIGRLLLLSARQLEAEQKLDAALNRYVAALRFARHVANRGLVAQWKAGTDIEVAVAEWMPAWAAASGQTPDRVEEAVRRVERELDQFPPFLDALRVNQLIFRESLMDWTVDPDADRDIRIRLLDRCFPWEPTRAVRVVDLVDTDQLWLAATVDRYLAADGADLSRWIDGTEAALIGNNPPPLSTWVATTPRIARMFSDWRSWIWQARVPVEASRRALVVKLGLLAWKSRHGQFPNQLDRLAGTVLDKVPLDPFNGQEFGYRPEGFPTDVSFGNRIIRAGEPVFWSAGPRGARVIQKGRTEDGLPQFVVCDRDGRTDQSNGVPGAFAFTIP